MWYKNTALPAAAFGYDCTSLSVIALRMYCAVAETNTQRRPRLVSTTKRTPLQKDHPLSPVRKILFYVLPAIIRTALHSRKHFTCIQEMHGSNFSRCMNIRLKFSLLSSVPPNEWRGSSLIYATYAFPVISSKVSVLFDVSDICCY
jgi:hypothetical protein